MPNKRLNHVSLGTGNFSSQVTQVITLDASLSNRKLSFVYTSRIIRGDPDKVFAVEADFIDPNITELLDIKIEEDCWVQMWLRNIGIGWHWRSRDAITTVEPRKSQYTQLQYLVNGAWVPEPEEEARCQAIRFGAIHRGGSVRIDDPFNINLILEWGTNEVLPITIDPDIQNPKV